MSNDRASHRDRFAPRHPPYSGQARVATLRNLADCAGAAFGWDEDGEQRLDRAARLHAARRALTWTLACIALVMFAYAVIG
ncbi:MAG: hypothetical protein ACXIVD_00530 [Salinarimonas sp.]